MTLIKPQLSIQRLIVLKDGKPVFDENFHDGINILYGQNGSGKSTIVDFIYYSLGGVIQEWKNEAKLCDTVYNQVSANGISITLRRDISDNKKQHIDVYFGSYDSLQQISSSEWKRFQYARSESKESFSQFFFKTLGLPEAKGEAASIITMNQILRLLYKDQLTSVDHIFKQEVFDTSLTRDTIAMFLLGVYDFDLYDMKIEYDEKRKQLDSITHQIKSYHKFLAKLGQEYTLKSIEDRIDKLNNDKIILLQQQQKLKEKPSKKLEGSQAQIEKLKSYKDLQKITNEVSELTSKKTNLWAEINDSYLFITMLQQRITEIEESRSTATSLGISQIQYCPICFSRLIESKTGTCSLCKTDLEGEKIKSNLLRMKSEFQMQLRESKDLIQNKLLEHSQLTHELSTKNELREQFFERYKSIEGLATTEYDVKLLETTNALGYLSRELEDLTERKNIIIQFSEYYTQQNILQNDVNRLHEAIKVKTAAYESNGRSATGSIESFIASLLKMDTQREDDFSSPKHVSISFESDKITVNGKYYFSASSMAILRCVIFIALFQYSLETAQARLPRFLIIDSIEDKGMEPERYHNMQNILYHISTTTDITHQIILTTADISPGIKGKDIVIGQYYTKSNKTLKFEGTL